MEAYDSIFSFRSKQKSVKNEKCQFRINILQRQKFNLPDWRHKRDSLLNQMPNFETQNKNIYISFYGIKTVKIAKSFAMTQQLIFLCSISGNTILFRPIFNVKSSFIWHILHHNSQKNLNSLGPQFIL